MTIQNKSMDFTFPENFYFEKDTHIWSHPESDIKIRIGIDSLLLASLGELAYLSLNDLGSKVKQGNSIGVLEAAKMTGEIIAPINGIILERNQSVLTNPLKVNQDPYGKGWLVMIETENWEDDSAKLITGSEIIEWSVKETQRYHQQGWIG